MCIDSSRACGRLFSRLTPFLFLPFLIGEFSICADGDLDTTFGELGKVMFIGRSAETDEIQDLVVQPDGKIVCIGHDFPFDHDLFLIRLNPDGSLDPTFGIGGKISYDFGGDDYGLAGVLLPDGRLFVVGLSEVSGQDNILLVRLNPDGTLDSSYGTGGSLLLPGGYGVDVLLMPGGKMVLGLTVAGPRTTDFGFLGLNPDGSLDSSFGLGGLAVVDFGGQDSLVRLALTLDGRIVAAGLSDSDELLVCIVDSGGQLDSSFDGDGKVALALDVGFRSRVGVAVQMDGKIVVASGHKETPPYDEIDSDLVLARLDLDGTLDLSFGQGGVSVHDPSLSDDFLEDLAVLPDGRILAVGAVGYFEYPHVPDFLLQRYNSDGSLDLSFGNGGWIRTDFVDKEWGRRVILQTSGKILVGGYGPDPNSDARDFALARYLYSVDQAAAFQVLTSSIAELLPRALQSLTVLVDQATDKLAGARPEVAIHELRAFQRRVAALGKNENLWPEYARRLVENAEFLISSMTDGARLRQRRALQPVRRNFPVRIPDRLNPQSR